MILMGRSALGKHSGTDADEATEASSTEKSGVSLSFDLAPSRVVGVLVLSPRSTPVEDVLTCADVHG